MNLENRQAQHVESWRDVEKVLSSKIDDRGKVSALMSRIRLWTGQQPFLERLLCDYVLKEVEAVARQQDDAVIDSIAKRKIVRNWKRRDAAGHLKQIQTMLLDYEARDSLLILYLQVLQRDSVPANDSPEQSLLLRAGLIKKDNNRLRLSNKLYSTIFDERWMEQQLPGITKPVTIIRKVPAARKSSARRSPTHKSLARKSAESIPRTNASSRQSRSPFFSQKATLAFWGIFAIALIALIYWQRSSGAANEVSSETVVSSTAVDSNEADSSQGLVQLSLLGDTFSGYSTFRTDDFQSALKSTGLQINYADEFDQVARAKKLDTGEADLIVTTLDQFLQHQPKGKIVGLLDRTIGADAVVLNTRQYNKLKSLIDLKQLVQQAKNKEEKLSIAYAADTPSEYLALVLDTQIDNFSLSDFELKPVADASEAWELMQKPEEKVAIAVLWEPYVAQARQQGYSVALSSKDAPNVIVDVIVASDRVLQSQPQAISQLLEKYYRRIDANIKDATQFQTQVAEDGNLAIKDAASILSGIDFFTATEARNWLSNGTLAKRIESTAAILTLSDRLEGVPTNPEDLYSAKYVIEAANNTQALIDLVEADNPALAAKLAGEGSTVLPAESPEKSATTEAADLGSDIGNFQVRGQVSFKRDATELTEEGKQTLARLADELQAFNEETIAIRVIGHTSRSGDPKMNLALSQQRAETVAKQLRLSGIQLNVLSEGKGFSEPLSDTPPESPDNQRTEIRLVRIK